MKVYDYMKENSSLKITLKHRCRKKRACKSCQCAAMEPGVYYVFCFPKRYVLLSFPPLWSQCAYMSLPSLRPSLNFRATLDNCHNLFLPRYSHPQKETMVPLVFLERSLSCLDKCSFTVEALLLMNNKCFQSLKKQNKENPQLYKKKNQTPNMFSWKTLLHCGNFSWCCCRNWSANLIISLPSSINQRYYISLWT